MSTRSQSPEPEPDFATSVAPRPDSALDPAHDPARGRLQGGHLLMMLLMCVPILLVVGVLVLTGRAGSTSILAALLCVGMMAAMMGMPGGHDRR